MSSMYQKETRTTTDHRYSKLRNQNLCDILYEESSSICIFSCHYIYQRNSHYSTSGTFHYWSHSTTENCPQGYSVLGNMYVFA